MTSALLIIDVQEGLFTPPPADAAGTVARINQLSERARRAGVPLSSFSTIRRTTSCRTAAPPGKCSRR